MIVVTDRTQVDVDYARNHPEAVADLKGAFNVSDHLRIENNTEIVKEQVALVAIPPTLEYSNPTTATIGLPAIINALALNLKALRDVLFPTLETVPGYTELKTDYAGGDTINYQTINTFEQNLLTLHTLAANQYDTAPFCDFYCGEEFM